MIYLDNAASTPCIQSVRETMEDACNGYSNVHRSFHADAEGTTLAFEDARLKVANLIGADREEIVFTSGATEAINIVARGLEWMFYPGDEIMVTVMDHHSNLVPWIALAKRTGATLRVVPIDNFGNINERAYRELLNEHTKLVALPVVSNVLGTRNNISKLTRAARKAGALVLADAAQSIAHYPHDVKDMSVDFMVFSGHKMFGPTGIGVLYIKEIMIDQVELSSFGGGMPGLDVYLDIDHPMYQWDIQTRMFESGTPPIIQAIGLGAAVDFIQCGMTDHHMRRIREGDLTEYAFKRLSDLGVRILGGGYKGRSPLISFVVKGVHSHDVAAYLADEGIAVRAGTHCARPLHRALNCDGGSVRASFNFLNNWSDIDALCSHVERIQKEFGGNTK